MKNGWKVSKYGTRLLSIFFLSGRGSKFIEGTGQESKSTISFHVLVIYYLQSKEMSPACLLSFSREMILRLNLGSPLPPSTRADVFFDSQFNISTNL